MADEPDNLVLVQLREIRNVLDQHTTTLAEHTRKLDEIAQELRSAKMATRFAVGSAGVAENTADRALRLAEDTAEALKAFMADGDGEVPR